MTQNATREHSQKREAEPPVLPQGLARATQRLGDAPKGGNEDLGGVLEPPAARPDSVCHVNCRGRLKKPKHIFLERTRLPDGEASIALY